MAKSKIDVTRKVRKTGFTKDGFTKLGFVFKDLDASQAAYCCIFNANKWLQSNFGLSISAFYMSNASPCFPPIFARFHVADTEGFDGNLVATSAETLFAIKNATRARRYYYIYDLEWRRPWFNVDKEEFNRLMNDKSIVKFTRSVDHLNALKEDGYEVSNHIVTDFDVDQILEIINANNRND